MGAGGRSAWAKMTAEERSAEMRRRAVKRRPPKRRAYDRRLIGAGLGSPVRRLGLAIWQARLFPSVPPWC